MMDAGTSQGRRRVSKNKSTMRPAIIARVTGMIVLLDVSMSAKSAFEIFVVAEQTCRAQACDWSCSGGNEG
jgi:hypothetical protein